MFKSHLLGLWFFVCLFVFPYKLLVHILAEFPIRLMTFLLLIYKSPLSIRELSLSDVCYSCFFRFVIHLLTLRYFPLLEILHHYAVKFIIFSPLIWDAVFTV